MEGMSIHETIQQIKERASHRIMLHCAKRRDQFRIEGIIQEAIQPLANALEIAVKALEMHKEVRGHSNKIVCLFEIQGVAQSSVEALTQIEAALTAPSSSSCITGF